MSTPGPKVAGSIRQLAGMRGLNRLNSTLIGADQESELPRGPGRPGYFIATHGARKGLADLRLPSADSGYLARRLLERLPGRHRPRGGLRHPRADQAGSSWIDAGDRQGALGDPGLHRLRHHPGARRHRRRGQPHHRGRRRPRRRRDQAAIDAGVREITVAQVLTCDSSVGTAAC